MGATAVYFSDAMEEYANLLAERVSILTAAGPVDPPATGSEEQRLRPVLKKPK
jgi:hypothetical protein